MTDIIVKPNRDEDFYVLWNLNTDSPFAWGTRADLESMKDKHFPKHQRNARFQRADNTSTSGLGGYASSWDAEDKHYVYHGHVFIAREKIRELCRIMDGLPSDGSQDECAEIMALMDPDYV